MHNAHGDMAIDKQALNGLKGDEKEVWPSG